MGNIILLICAGIFALFLVAMWFVVKNPETGKAFGVQKSISANYKLLLAVLPQAAHSIWLLLFFLLAVGIIATGQNAWFFGSAVGLCGVGAFPEYWERDDVKKHVAAAYLAYLVPVLYLLFFDGHVFTTVLSAVWVAFAALCSLKVITINHSTTVYEIAGFAVIITGLMW